MNLGVSGVSPVEDRPSVDSVTKPSFNEGVAAADSGDKTPVSEALPSSLPPSDSQPVKINKPNADKNLGEESASDALSESPKIVDSLGGGPSPEPSTNVSQMPPEHIENQIANNSKLDEPSPVPIEPEKSEALASPDSMSDESNKSEMPSAETPDAEHADIDKVITPDENKPAGESSEKKVMTKEEIREMEEGLDDVAARIKTIQEKLRARGL